MRCTHTQSGPRAAGWACLHCRVASVADAADADQAAGRSRHELDISAAHTEAGWAERNARAGCAQETHKQPVELSGLVNGTHTGWLARHVQPQQQYSIGKRQQASMKPSPAVRHRAQGLDLSSGGVEA